MRVRFWGTRGSLPVALTAEDVRTRIARVLVAARGRTFRSQRDAGEFIDSLPFDLRGTYGGHTSCVQIQTAAMQDEVVLCDLGSGARPLGQQLLGRQGRSLRMTFHVFLSHAHWDHIMGFPFFAPAYLPGCTIRLYGGHPNLLDALVRQQDAPSFPVPLSALPAKVEYQCLEPGRVHEIAGLRVTLKQQLHGGDSYGFRFEQGSRCVVYSTDSEHKLADRAEMLGFAEFFRDADLVIFDAMYSLADLMTVKADWGHSSNVIGVELCQLAGARRLAMFHHEPMFGDARLAEIEAETQRLESITRGERRALQVLSAYDGLEIEL